MTEENRDIEYISEDVREFLSGMLHHLITSGDRVIVHQVSAQITEDSPLRPYDIVITAKEVSSEDSDTGESVH